MVLRKVCADTHPLTLEWDGGCVCRCASSPSDRPHQLAAVQGQELGLQSEGQGFATAQSGGPHGPLLLAVGMVVGVEFVVVPAAVVADHVTSETCMTLNSACRI